IFHLDPERPGSATAVTDGPFDHLSPTVLGDGTVLYVATEDAHSQLRAIDGQSTVQWTDLPTGAFEPATGPDGGVWSLVLHHGG
ncbi:hypothetical protein, partial [Streptococcus pneumoniae]|uniref:hypothetical protein n=1 Tax=Streptococcus pneumoniae TaxID=1313 RepID=UPI0018B0E6A5